jgi:general secretion pathway protein L
MAARIWGIDLGSHSVKLCEIETSFRGFALSGFQAQRVVLPEGGELLAAQMVALQGLLKSFSGRPEALVVALPGVSAATHMVSLPFVDTRKVEQTLSFEVEGQIPFDLKDVNYDYQILDQGRGRSELLVGVARRDFVLALLAALANLGLEPRTLTLGPLAYQSLMMSLPPGGADQTGPAEAVVDIGHERTCILVRDQGKVVYARTVVGGGATLTRALARATGSTWEAAEELKEARGSLLDDADPAVAAPLSGAWAGLVRDIRQTIRSGLARGRRPLERIWVTGGSARLTGVPQRLERELNCAVAPLPVRFPAGELQLAPEAEPLGALAVSLALRGWQGPRGGRLNLRRGDQSLQGDFAKMRRRALRVGALLLVLLTLSGVRAYAHMFVLGRREKAIDDVICSSTQKVVGKCIRDVNVARSSLLGGGAATASIIPEISALDLLSEVSSRMSIDGAKVTEMDVSVDSVHLRGEADGFETVDKVVAGLKTFRCFQDIQRGRVQRLREGSGIEFNLEIRSSCGATPGGSH